MEEAPGAGHTVVPFPARRFAGVCDRSSVEQAVAGQNAILST